MRFIGFLLAVVAISGCEHAGIVSVQRDAGQKRDAAIIDTGFADTHALSDQALPADVQQILDASTQGDATVADAAMSNDAAGTSDSSNSDVSSFNDAANVEDVGAANDAASDAALMDQGQEDAFSVADAAREDSTVYDPCDPNPCAEAHKGQCLNNQGQALCTCDDNFTDYGDGECRPVAPCSPNPCTETHKEKCLNDQGQALCSCDDNYTDYGDGECRLVDPCSPNPCTESHKGICLNNQGLALCSCDDTYVDYGDGECRPVDPCSPNPCVEANKGSCVAQTGYAQCYCDESYTDDGTGRCVPVASCDPNPCVLPHRSQCAISDNAVSCSCDTGFSENANGDCVAPSLCEPNPCTEDHRGLCLVVADQVTCQCDDGFEEDGLGSCVVAVEDPCAAGCATGISGRVTHGGAALPNIRVVAYTGNCPLGQFVGNATSDANGYFYIATGVQTELYLRAGMSDQALWWNTSGGQANCALREASVVVEDVTSTARDFVYPAGGAIGGRISNGTAGIGPGLRVNFYQTNCGGSLSQYALTDDNGDYLATGLPTGDIYVAACPSCRAGFESYADRWWTALNGAVACADAEATEVRAFQLSANRDINLETPALMSGTITLDSQAVSGVLVHATTGRCGEGEVMDATLSDENGLFEIDMLPAGEYYLETRMRNQDWPRYVDMWWTSAGGSIDCSLAESSTLVSGSQVHNLDFSLAEGGQVSGRVTESAQAVEGVYVWAHITDCTRNDERAWYAPALSDANGDYVIPGLPAGDVLIYVSSSSSFPTVGGWWTGAASGASCEEAVSVSIVDGSLTGSVDFSY